MRCTLIVNRRAGRKGGLPVNLGTADDALAALAAHGIAPAVAETARPGHATELARAAALAGDDVVIAAGGDGTVREAATGLIGSHVPLGVMPLGSVMNVAHMLGIPRDPQEAAAVIAAGACAEIDVGRAGGTRQAYFLEAAGVGIDAALFAYGNAIDAGRWGAVWGALRLALRYRPRRVVLELDGWRVELPALMVSVANGPFCGAGLRVAPEARVDDHRFDVRVFGPMPKAALLRSLARPEGREGSEGREGREGREGHEGQIYTFKARDVRIAAPRGPLPGHADACPLGSTPLRFSLLPGALRVLVGSSAALAGEPHTLASAGSQAPSHPTPAQ